ncbi:hypothetical protein [Mucilaginibacter flavus]|uniref:hypothetical protein n=1 Tax=Mucilaginibacter flavus TaxID=931504 RepID=UPI0025B36EB9|nr:hypothetical protein [Mucilaginibacter flavus]MDN3583964.1 hypothetical protein [Mucilaginibacter flavus]
MRKHLTILCLLVLCAGCEKEVKTADIIPSLSVSPTSIDADGSSQVTVTAVMTDQAAADKRNVVFTTTAGSWAGGANGKVTIPAVYQNGQIVAVATLTAPSSETKITITAAAQATSINGDYQQTATVQANNVAPAKIHLEPSSLGIAANYAAEDTLTAKISGAKGGNASKGVKVLFEDNLGVTGGHFRQLQTTSDGTSKVSAIYGVPTLSSGTPVLLTVTVLDASGAKTNISDVVTLTIK